MNCPFCGYENDDDATNCASCGAPLKPHTDQGIPTAAPPPVEENFPDASLPGEQQPIMVDIPPEMVREVEPPVVHVYDSDPVVPLPAYEPGVGSPTVKRSNALVWVLIGLAVVLLCTCSACMVFSVILPAFRATSF